MVQEEELLLAIFCILQGFSLLCCISVVLFGTTWSVTPLVCSGPPLKIIDKCFANVVIFSFSSINDGKGCPFTTKVAQFSGSKTQSIMFMLLEIS